MGLERKRHIRYGAPDAIALGLIALVMLCAALWARANLRPDWEQAAGTVVSCDLVKREYGAVTGPEQVRITYQYDVHGRPYTSSWEGFWPQANSPNALPQPELPKLRVPGYTLSVAYDPDNPAVNLLHRSAQVTWQFYPWLTLGLLGLVVVYLLRIYPLWKRRTG